MSKDMAMAAALGASRTRLNLSKAALLALAGGLRLCVMDMIIYSSLAGTAH